MLSQLRKLVETEGYLTQTDTLLKQLSPMLKADVERDLRDFRKDIQKLLESEIVKRYYYQIGYYEFFLRYDDWLAKAIESIK